MEKFIIKGGKRLQGDTIVSGAKNVALKALVAACLTDEEVIVENVPLISDFFVMTEIIKELGGKVEIKDHAVKIQVEKIKKGKVSLEKAAQIRTSVLFLAPLLARFGRAAIPNPGGCRIGARPIDRTIDGLKKMNVNVDYNRDDGYFRLSIPQGKELKGVTYKFEKNTHTGTETLLLVSVLAHGRTVLENAAAEPEVDELIELLNAMGADIKRINPRTIVINGVKKLNGVKFWVGPDRNEIITLAVAAIMTDGDIFVRNAKRKGIVEFLDKLKEANGNFEEKTDGIRFYSSKLLKPTNVVTSCYPGFMTDWQGPWAILMTKAVGVSMIHEAVYESRFGYVGELRKMGAKIEFFKPKVENPQDFYNFNLEDDKDEFSHAIKILGPRELHNGIVTISDLRAGATLVLAALAAKGQSVIFGLEHLDRGYEHFEGRLKKLGADIKRINE